MLILARSLPTQGWPHVLLTNVKQVLLGEKQVEQISLAGPNTHLVGTITDRFPAP